MAFVYCLRCLQSFHTIFLWSSPNDSIIGAAQHEANRHDAKVVINILKRDNYLKQAHRIISNFLRLVTNRRCFGESTKKMYVSL